MGKHGAGTFRRRGSSIQLVVSAGFDPLTGRRLQRTKSISLMPDRDARKELAKFVTEISDERPGAAEGQKRTVAELLDKWLAQHRTTVDVGDMWEGEIERYILPHIGSLLVGQVTAETIDDLYRHLSAAGGVCRRQRKNQCPTKPCPHGGGNPLSPGSVRHAHTVLNLAFDRARRWGWIAFNPVRDATPPPIRKKKAKPPAVETVRTLLDHTAELDPNYYAFLRLAALLGTRRGETAATQRADLDFDAMEVKVWHAIVHVKGGIVDLPRTKASDEEERIAMDPVTAEALRRVIERQDKCAAELGIAMAPNPYLFSGDPLGARPYSPSWLTVKFSRLRADLGVPATVQLKHLRNYMITETIRATGDVDLAKRRARHANITMTSDVYAGDRPAQDHEVAALLAERLSAP